MALRAARFGELTTYERSVGAVIADSGNDVRAGDELVLLGGVHHVDAVRPDGAGCREAWCHGRPYLKLFPRTPYKVLPRVRAVVV